MRGEGGGKEGFDDADAPKGRDLIKKRKKKDHFFVLRLFCFCLYSLWFCMFFLLGSFFFFFGRKK